MLDALELIPQQQKCLDLQRNMTVIAGAGSGKTRVLVERYVEILRTSDLQVDNLVAITFTRKAAAEMLDRVRLRIGSLLASASELRNGARWDRVREDLSRAHICTIHAFCERLLRQYPIEAGIDPSFQVIEEPDNILLMQEAVREAMLEVSRLPEGEPARDALADLLSWYSRHHLHDVLFALLWHRRETSPYLRKLASMSDAEAEAAVEFQQLSLQSSAIREWLADEKLCSDIIEISRLLPKDRADAGFQRVQEVLPHLLALQEGKDDLPTAEHMVAVLLAFTQSDGSPYKKFPGTKKNWDPDVWKRFHSLAISISERVAKFRERIVGAMGELDRIHARVLRRIGILFGRAEARLEQKKGPGLLLDFDDLERYVLRMFEPPDSSNILLSSLQRRFRHVMVDEFQDTNSIQWHIIRPIVCDGDGKLRPDALFIVGDPKQSIYGFRGADVRVLNRVRKELIERNRETGAERRPCMIRGKEVESSPEERLGEVTLARNFRALPRLVDFVNDFFPTLMPSSPDPKNEFEVWYSPMEGHRGLPGSPDAKRHPPGIVQMLSPLVTKSERESESASALEAQMVAAMIAHITAPESGHRVWVAHDFDGNPVDDYVPAAYGHVALLFRSRTHLLDYEIALRARGIPYAVYHGIGFFQQQEIADIHNLFAFLANERDDLSLVGVLRSPLFALSDEALFWLTRQNGDSLWKKLASADPQEIRSHEDARVLSRARALLPRWRTMTDRMAPSDLLCTVLDDTGYLGALMGTAARARAAANVEKLLDHLRNMEAAHPVAMRDIAARLEFLRENEPAEGQAQLEMEHENCVKLLTVHAAKGLEFPIVFIPDMDRGFNFGESDIAQIDEEIGIGLTVPDPNARGKREPPFIRKHIQSRIRDKILAEEKRLLYVACTRARDELYLVGATDAARRKRANKSWWTWVMQYLKSDSKLAKELHSRIITSIEDIPIPAEMKPLALLIESLCEKPESDRPVAFSSSVERADLLALGSVEEPRLFPTFSPTAIMEFERCPAAYFYRNVMGLSEWEYEEEISARDERFISDPVGLLVGRVTHAMLQELHRLMGISRDEMCEWAERLARAECEGGSAHMHEAAQAAVALAMRCVRSAFLRRIADMPESYAELPFSLKLRSGVLSGRIDRVCRADEKTWWIVDYKTTRIEGSITPQTLRSEYERQMQAYALAVQKLMARPEERVKAFLYLTEQDEAVPYEWNEEELHTIEADIESKLRAMNELRPEQISITPRPACAECGYRERVCRYAPLPAPLRRATATC